MPTSITVPVAERSKSVKFGAPYSPSQSFNPDKALQFQCSGILTGLGITLDTGPTPDEVTVDPGAFIQNGIIVDITNSQLVQVPEPTTFPLFLVAENANEVTTSDVDILFTTSPAADSTILAEWQTGPITDFEIPTHVSNCALRDAIDNVISLVIQREEQTAAGGQTIFTLPAAKSYVLGANKIHVYRNGKKLRESGEYAETDSTTITLNFGATAGDKMEFIIFKSEPPITSIALTDLTDVTGDLANGIKDVSALRSSIAEASNPLATLDDVTTSVNAAIATAYTQTTLYSKTSGNIGIGDTGGVMTDVPDGGGFAEVVQNITAAHTGLVIVQASVGISNGTGRASVGLGIKLNGAALITGYALLGGLGGSSIIAGGYATVSTEGGGINNTSSNMSFVIPVSLIVGVNTIRLQFNKDSAGGGALIFASTAAPLQITLLHKG